MNRISNVSQPGVFSLPLPLPLLSHQVQTLRLAILPEVNSSNFAGGHKRRIYLLLFIGLVQPFLMYWLSSTAIKAAITDRYFGYYSYYSGRYY